MAQAVDVDDMDANLFKSFQSQRKMQRSREKDPKPASVKKSEGPSEVDDKIAASQPTENEGGSYVLQSLKDKQNDRKGGLMSTKKNQLSKQNEIGRKPVLI